MNLNPFKWGSKALSKLAKGEELTPPPEWGAGDGVHGHGSYAGRVQFVNENVPLFWLYYIPEMLRHHSVRLGMGVLRGIMQEARYEVLCDNAQVAAFVEKQLETYSAVCVQHSLRRLEYGWVPLEVIYRVNGSTLELERMEYRHPRLAKAVLHNRRLIGAKFMTKGDEKYDHEVFLPFPKVYWPVHRSHTHPYWGQSHLDGPHVYYLEWMTPDGFFDARRTYLRKSVFPPTILYYPDSSSSAPRGNDTPRHTNRDLATEALRLARNNSGIAIPRRESGVDLWGVEKMGDVGDVEKVTAIGHSLDEELWQAMELPPEILRTDGTGSYTGREIPLLQLLSVCHSYVTEDVLQLKRQVLDFLVGWNFGTVPYSIRVKPLREFMTEGLGDADPEGGAANPQPVPPELADEDPLSDEDDGSSEESSGDGPAGSVADRTGPRSRADEAGAPGSAPRNRSLGS